MFKRILSFFLITRRKSRHQYISSKDLKEYMQIEGILYGDMFPLREER